MNRNSTVCAILMLVFSATVLCQDPTDVLLKVVKAEDALRYDSGISSLFKHSDARVRSRAALAAGRIGDEAAVAALIGLLSEKNEDVCEMAAFALGEIESSKAAPALLAVLRKRELPDNLLARAVEAAGKIAAANATDPASKELGEAILDVLESEDRKRAKQSKKVILLALTAALRARPANAELVLARFFTNMDSRIREDAANAYARVRGKTAGKKLQAMLLTDDSPVARANAARALGAMEDKTAINMLLEAAEADDDLRVRVNALRALGSIKEAGTANRLMGRAETLLKDYKESKFANPVEQNEIFEIVTALGNVLERSGDERAFAFLKEIFLKSGYRSAEITTAMAKIDLAAYREYFRKAPNEIKSVWYASSAAIRGYRSVSDYVNEDSNKDFRESDVTDLRRTIENTAEITGRDAKWLFVIPDFLAAFAGLKPDDLDPVLRSFLQHEDLFIRASAAELLGERVAGEGTVSALQTAFRRSIGTDKDSNDAQLAILSSLVKLDKAKAKESLELALDHYDILIRRQALRLIKENGLEKEFPKAGEKIGTVGVFDPKTGSKLGQLLNGDEDYKRALSRRNGSVNAIVSTEKGKFTIDFFPEEAPLTVDNFIKLARSGYFDGISIHRVVPNFVVQDGDPRGDGNGGPGWQIRCEINQIPYERGMVGMALSGKDTGGSQWFITHSPQPHLDGGYTVFGRVNESDMKIVDDLARGDRIVSIEIIEKK